MRHESEMRTTNNEIDSPYLAFTTPPLSSYSPSFLGRAVSERYNSSTGQKSLLATNNLLRFCDRPLDQSLDSMKERIHRTVDRVEEAVVAEEKGREDEIEECRGEEGRRIGEMEQERARRVVEGMGKIRASESTRMGLWNSDLSARRMGRTTSWRLGEVKVVSESRDGGIESHFDGRRRFGFRFAER